MVLTEELRTSYVRYKTGEQMAGNTIPVRYSDTIVETLIILQNSMAAFFTGDDTKPGNNDEGGSNKIITFVFGGETIFFCS